MVSTATIILGGIPAAIYERFIGAKDDSTEASLWIWLAGTAHPDASPPSAISSGSACEARVHTIVNARSPKWPQIAMVALGKCPEAGLPTGIDAVEDMRRIAFETVLRACGFGSLAIFCVMIGLSFEPRVAFQTGGVLTLVMTVILIFKA